jgi:hypothetical protein
MPWISDCDLEYSSVRRPVGGRKACIPANADMNQIVDVFRGYLKEHPEKRHLISANLAGEAFSQAFPRHQR